MLVVKPLVDGIPKSPFVLHGQSFADLERRVHGYLPTWEWVADEKQPYGGYWLDCNTVHQFVAWAATRFEEKIIEAAYGWHLGGDSALYQFASTGCVFDEDHRKRLLAELGTCVRYIKDSDDRVFNELVNIITNRTPLATSPTGR